ncbi:MAG: PD-(D/E)XK nuclease family transposase [Desulfosporosinus sp.]
MELPKLRFQKALRNENDPVIQWMEFLNVETKGAMEMLSEKNPAIKEAYERLQVISQDKTARMLYEAKPAKPN